METSALPVLRPLRLGELLDQAVRLYRHNFLTFVGIIALVFIPYALLQVLVSLLSISFISGLETAQSDPQSYFFSPGYLLIVLGSMLTPFIYLVFVNGLGTAVLTHAVSQNYLGQKTGILEAYRELGTSWLRLLLTLILFGLLVIAAFIWIIIPCVGWLTGFGLFIFLIGIVGPLLPPVVMIEKLDGIKSISRAWYLARRRFWWLFGFAVIFYLFNLLVVSGPTILISYLVGLITGSGDSLTTASVLSTLIPTVVSSLIQLLVLPIQLTAWTLVYFDLRVRTEGFDLALLTMNVSAENTAPDISSLPVAAPMQKWLTWDDIGKFVVVTLVGGGLYALIVGVLAAIGVGMNAFQGL